MSLAHKAILSMLLGRNGFDPSFTPILQVISIRKIGMGVGGDGDERWKVSLLYFLPLIISSYHILYLTFS